MSILGRHEVALKRGFQILRGVALTNGMGGSEKEFQWLYMPGILKCRWLYGTQGLRLLRSRSENQKWTI